MKRKSLLMILLMAFFAPLAMNAQKAMTVNGNVLRNAKALTNAESMIEGNRDGGPYELVTSAQSDWSGNYLLATPWNETTAYAFDGTVDEYNTGGFTAVTLDGTTITSAGDAAVLTIAQSTAYPDYYTIRINGGDFLWDGSNGLATTSDESDDPIWDITVTSEGIQLSNPYWGVGAYNLYFVVAVNDETGNASAFYVTDDSEEHMYNSDDIEGYTFYHYLPYLFKEAGSDLCDPEDMCEIRFELTDSYGDGWNGNAIQVVDAATNQVLATWTIGSGYSASGSLSVCDGRAINFVWVSGSYAYETSYVVYDANNQVILRGEAGEGMITNYTVACPSCAIPSNLSVANITNNSATISWTSNASGWNLRYKKASESSWTTVNRLTQMTYTMSNLEAGTAYEVEVQADCESVWASTSFTTNLCATEYMCEIRFELTDAWGDGWNGAAINVVDVVTGNVVGSITNRNLNGTQGSGENELNTLTLAVCDGRAINFVWVAGSYDSECSYVVYDSFDEVILQGAAGNGMVTNYTVSCSSACAKPKDLAASNITATSAELSWKGEQESYNVRYRILSVLLEEGFEDGLPSTWTVIDNDGDGFNWESHINTGSGNHTTHTGDGCMTSASYDNDNETELYPDNWLITPQVQLGGSMSFWAIGQDASWCQEHFRVYVSTTGTAIRNFTPVSEEFIAQANYTQYNIDLSAYSGNGYIAIVHQNISDMFFLNVDDVTVYAPSTWITTTATEATVAITGLAQSTEYEWQVQGICEDGETDWVAGPSFTTAFGMVKDIVGYGTNAGGYYLIASPVDEAVTPAESNGFLTEDYDLYYFDQTQDLEWINYKSGAFNIVNGKGYLYASKEDTQLVFSGTPYSGDGKIELSYDDAASFKGWNLVGNPFSVTAYTPSNREFYTMKEDGSEIIGAESNEVAAMEGIFVVAEGDGETITFSTTNPNAKRASLVLNLSQANNLVDRAIVRFGEGRQLPKFQLNESHTKVFMTVESKDYAVVYTENEGEMPVSFKAESNGTYTLSINTEDVEFGYLHLIDNMTGNDVDLLSSPSYSFEAKTTDYANRFRLVFNADNSNDNFAFFNGSNWTVSNEGNATLQVMDVTGRIISSENINGCANVNVNAAPGVYMIRLVNGENVKVQKVVVR